MAGKQETAWISGYRTNSNNFAAACANLPKAKSRPHVIEWDEASHFPMEIMPKLAEMGSARRDFSRGIWRGGLGYIEYVIAIEELSRVDGSVGIIVAAHNSLCSNHIFKFGNDAQKKKYLVPLAQGKKIGAWSLTEPEAGLRCRRNKNHRGA